MILQAGLIAPFPLLCAAARPLFLFGVVHFSPPIISHGAAGNGQEQGLVFLCYTYCGTGGKELFGQVCPFKLSLRWNCRLSAYNIKDTLEASQLLAVDKPNPLTESKVI